MKYILNSIFLFLIFYSAASAQQDSILAKVGTDKIASEEFKERFELTPQVYNNGTDHYTKKEDLLYSLIAEKLWAQEATQLGYDTTEIMEITFKALEKMYVRDALYKAEISNKIKITDKELGKELYYHFTNLELKVLHTKDSSEIFSLYGKLNKGLPFDSLLTLKNESKTPIEVKYGELDETVSKLLYKLKINRYSEPVRTNAGWIIFYLSSINKVSYSSEDLESALKDAKQKIEKEKSIQLAEEYLKKFFKGKQVPIDMGLFQNIVEKITEVVSTRKSKDLIPDSVSVYLKNEDILQIEKEFGPDTLGMNFIKFDNNPFSVRDFLRYFIFEGFYTNKVDEKTITAKLNSRVKLMIQDELLSREGYRRGFENSPEVKSAINIWRENYLAQLLKDKFIDSLRVTDEEIKDYYNNIGNEKNPNDTQVNILEVLTDSLDVIHQILDQLKKGVDFRTLASIHTKRLWTRGKGGEFGYFPSSMYGDIGKIAAKMNIGEVYGPIKTPNGYSLFKLIGKKEKVGKPTEPYNKIKDKLKKELLGLKRSKFFINYTINLANKFGVSINRILLSNIHVKDLNMYVYRYMGFGGRISAMPVTLPFVEWFKPWKDGEKVVP